MHSSLKASGGFTLLEVLVATFIMGLAVVGLLSGLAASVRNAARLSEHDRMAMLARAKMDQILVDYNIPLEAAFDGKFNASQAGGEDAGYHAVMSVFEAPPQARPGASILQRVVLKVWWSGPDHQRTLELEGFRRNQIPPDR